MLPGRNYTPEDIAAIAWRHKWIIASVVSVVTTGAIGWSLRLPDLYRSETLILVVPQRVPESYVRSTVTMRIEDRLRSLRQQILSRTNLERIIDDFELFRDDMGEACRMELIVEEMRQRVHGRHGARGYLQGQLRRHVPAHRDDRDRSAGQHVHRGEPARSRRARRRHQRVPRVAAGRRAQAPGRARRKARSVPAPECGRAAVAAPVQPAGDRVDAEPDSEPERVDQPRS